MTHRAEPQRVNTDLSKIFFYIFISNFAECENDEVRDMIVRVCVRACVRVFVCVCVRACKCIVTWNL